MADPKGPETGKDAKAASSARPRSPTLDLSATDVSPKASPAADPGKPGSADPADPKQDGAAKAPDAGKPEQPAKPADAAQAKAPANRQAVTPSPSASAASAEKPSPIESGKPSSASTADAATSAASSAQATSTSEPPKPAGPAAGATSAADASGGRSATQPVATPSRAGVGVFGAVLAALGGAALAVLAVALFGRELIDASQPADPRVAVLESRLESASRDLAALRTELAKPRPAVDTSALDGKISDIQQAVEGAGARIGKLEGAQQDLVKALDKRPAQDPAVPAIQGRLDGIELRLQQAAPMSAIDVIDGRIAGVEARSKELASRETLADISVRIDDLTKSVDGVDQTIGAATAPLKSRVDQIANTLKDRPKGDPAARLVVGLGALDAALAEGRPFAAELDAVKSSGGENAELAPLDPYAAKGLPTREALGAELAAAIAKLAPAKPQDSGSILDRFVASAGAVVKITPEGGAASGSDPSAQRERVAQLGSAGDIAGALAARGSLDEAARAATDEWAAQASARVSAENAIGSARTAALARLNSND